MEVYWDENPDEVVELPGRTAYYKVGKAAIPVTEEEFSQILTTLPDAVREQYEADIRSIELEAFEEAKSSNVAAPSSFPQQFFLAIAWVMWIGGIIVALVSSMTPDRWGNMGSMDATTFFTVALTYFVYGCISLCASYLFRYLRDICTDIRSIRQRMK